MLEIGRSCDLKLPRSERERVHTPVGYLHLDNTQVRRDQYTVAPTVNCDTKVERPHLIPGDAAFCE